MEQGHVGMETISVAGGSLRRSPFQGNLQFFSTRGPPTIVSKSDFRTDDGFSRGERLWGTLTFVSPIAKSFSHGGSQGVAHPSSFK